MQKTLSLLGYSWVSGIPMEKIEMEAIGENDFHKKVNEEKEVQKDFLDKYFDVATGSLGRNIKVPVRKDLEEWIAQRNKRSEKDEETAKRAS